MKKKMLLLATVLFVSLTPLALMAGEGFGLGDGTGPLHEIIGEFEWTGTVVEYLSYGGGMVIAATDGDVAVYGLGPIPYWKTQGIERPDVGENVTVWGLAVEINGETRNILTSILVEGEDEALQLRDTETGKPLWRPFRLHQPPVVGPPATPPSGFGSGFQRNGR
ncbi:MAG: hypothetical protein JW884_11995 [Deltaproteobacteria bacterium]|nr:hypothetical protein [Deltaproteobacteria bacterium]